MKSVNDYLKLVCEEGEAATNVVSSGAIASKEVPLGKFAKRKKAVEAAQLPNTSKDAIDVKVPLSDVYAPECAGTEIESGATPEEADEHKKKMFHLKQRHQSDQTISYD